MEEFILNADLSINFPKTEVKLLKGKEREELIKRVNEVNSKVNLCAGKMLLRSFFIRELGVYI